MYLERGGFFRPFFLFGYSVVFFDPLKFLSLKQWGTKSKEFPPLEHTISENSMIDPNSVFKNETLIFEMRICTISLIDQAESP